MKFTIHEPCNSYAIPLYLGERTRFATVTDVKFINETILLVAHRYAGKLYIVDISMSPNIRSEFQLIHNGKIQQTEMIEIVGNNVYVISYDEWLFCLRLANNKLTLMKVVLLNTKGAKYHGIQYHKEQLWITPSNHADGDDRIVLYKPTTNTITFQPSIGSQYRIKDIAFFPDDSCILLTNIKHVLWMTEKGSIFDSEIKIYDKSWNQTDVKKIENTHLDAVVTEGNCFYATASDLRGGWIIAGKIEKGKILNIQEIRVDDFPHGIALLGDKLAYTSYASESVNVIHVPPIL
jgi:hypothetical protein